MRSSNATEASARASSATTTSTTPISYVINREETHLSWVQNALAEYAPCCLPVAFGGIAGAGGSQDEEEG